MHLCLQTQSSFADSSSDELEEQHNASNPMLELFFRAHIGVYMEFIPLLCHFALDILCDKGETRCAQQHSSEDHCPGRKPPHPALRPARLTQIVKRIMMAIQMAVEQILTFSVPEILEKSPVCGSIFDSERVSHVSFCTFAFLHPEVDQGRELDFYLCTLCGDVLE